SMEPTHARLEQEIRGHAEASQWDEAATCALQGYGAEVLGFLHAVVPGAADADEAFSSLCEVVWARLPDFRFESSFRTWIYAVARNLAREQRRARQWRQRRFADLDGTSAAAKLAARVRSTTAIHLRSQTKTRLQQIRDALPADERALLVLRLDREMPWADIARVLAPGDIAEHDLPRESARLRKHFERVKTKLAGQLRLTAPDA
ncbi:MAG: sigma-70 family RNA polymerase sigma factor, partial [Myxococcota bacterium]